MQKLVIDTKRWLRGEGSLKSFLYRSKDKKMCCLGFYARQNCNLKVSEIKNETSIPSIRKYLVEDPMEKLGWLFNGMTSSDDGFLLMAINDATHFSKDYIWDNTLAYRDAHMEDNFEGLSKMTDKTRKSLLKKIFARNGVEVEFI